LAAPPSYDSAVRVPVPVTTTASALPLAQPGRETICCTTGDRSGVRCSAPRAPAVDQGAGAHVTFAAVRGREETFFDPVVNAAALSVASPPMVRFAFPVVTSSAWNWIEALVMVAPAGIDTPVNRRPTVCAVEPSAPRFRSPPVNEILVGDSSASAAPVRTGTSSTELVADEAIPAVPNDAAVSVNMIDASVIVRFIWR
jgi:hypothetical protein